MKRLRLLETCTQYSVTRNRYGDIVMTKLRTIPCLFRNISLLQRNINYREEVKVQGIFWFDPSTTLKQGDVVGFNGTFYRIERVIVANARLTTDRTHFIKCEVSELRQIS